MTSARSERERGRQRSAPLGGADELRRMVLLLETAEVLESRARRAVDPVQVEVLLRRAGQRRQEADRLREHLAAGGVAAPVAPAPSGGDGRVRPLPDRPRLLK